LYDWILDNVPAPARPRQIEFSRLNLQYCVVSKRKLIKLVTDGHVSGWDDPRMPTLCGLRRRGVPPEALHLFVERTGVSKADNNIDYSILEDCVREILDPIVPRAFAVLDPIRVVLTTWPEDEVDMVEGPKHPKLPDLGKRQIPFTRNLLIERTDFEEVPPPKYFRLKPGGEARLRFGYVIKVDEVIKDETGKVVELRCSHKPDTRQGSGKGFNETKVKGIIHWLPEDRCKRATVNVYDRLFSVANPGADHEDGDFLKDINPNSLEVFPNAAIEDFAAETPVGSCVQFERTGYFCVDPDSTPDNLVFNRVVTLRDNWAKS
jgi:glutaminyl-tRNA synthetase